MEETNFEKAKNCLKRAIRELKKGEHDQLGSGLFDVKVHDFADPVYIPLTIEEAIELLIKAVGYTGELGK